MTANALHGPADERRLSLFAILWPWCPIAGPRSRRRLPVPGWFILLALIAGTVALDLYIDELFLFIEEKVTLFVFAGFDPSVFRSGDPETSSNWFGTAAASAIFAAVMFRVGTRLSSRITYRYWVGETEIGVRGGWLQPWRRSIPIDRVVAIDRSTGLISHLLRRESVIVQTRAMFDVGDDFRVSGLGRKDAANLQGEIADRLQTALGSGNEPAVHIDAPRWTAVLNSGFLSFDTSAFVFFAFTAYHLLKNLLPDDPTDLAVAQIQVLTAGRHAVWEVVASIVSLLLVLWIASAMGFFTTFARYRLGTHGRLLVLEHGLLTKTRRLRVADAVNALELRQSPLQRGTGQASVYLLMAGDSSPNRARTMLHPAMQREDRRRILGAGIPGLPDVAVDAAWGIGIHPLSRRAALSHLRFWPLRVCLLCAAIAATMWYVGIDRWYYAFTGLVLAGIGILLSLVTVRHTGWSIHPAAWMTIHSGLFASRRCVMSSDHVQAWSFRWSAVPWRTPLLFELRVLTGASRGSGLIYSLLSKLRLASEPSLIRLKWLEAGQIEELVSALSIVGARPAILKEEGARAAHLLTD